jgi:hypothetical protein
MRDLLHLSPVVRGRKRLSIDAQELAKGPMLDYWQSNSLLTRPGLSDSGRLGCSELLPEQSSEDAIKDEASTTIAEFLSHGKGE